MTEGYDLYCDLLRLAKLLDETEAHDHELKVLRRYFKCSSCGDEIEQSFDMCDPIVCSCGGDYQLVGESGEVG